jgi:glycerate 2-kinase
LGLTPVLIVATMPLPSPPDLLERIVRAAVDACHPRHVVPACLPPRPAGRVVTIAAGKGAAAMAAAVETAWGPLHEGLAVTRHGHGAPTQGLRVVEASHPVPDSESIAAGASALDLVSGLDADDCVLVLLSGGGSALLAAPLPPVGLADKQQVTRALVLGGASIGEINCVRKHLSAIKGGRLATRAFPARVITIAISDVVGDDPSAIASGPTVADPTTQRDAMDVLARHGIGLAPSLATVLGDPRNETPKPGDALLARSSFILAARGTDLVAAACDAAQAAGLNTLVLGTQVEGEARQVGLAHAEIARQMDPGPVPLLLVSGGELTVRVRGQGRGGPNREYLLALARGLQGAAHIWAIACDSDGIDGSDAVAGGWIGPDTLARAQEARLDVSVLAARNDSAALFRSLGQEIVTGPTRTNVNDLRAILILPRS